MYNVYGSRQALDNPYQGVLGLFVVFFQAEDGIRDLIVTGVQTCALPISDGLPLASSILNAARCEIRVISQITNLSLARGRRVCVRTNGRRKFGRDRMGRRPPKKIGRASCRERV